MTAAKNSTRFKIVAADHDAPIDLWDKGAAEIGAEIVYGGVKSSQEVAELGRNADVVLVFRTAVTADVIAQLKNCKLLFRMGIGTDLIDVEAATRAGIFVTNAPDWCVEEVAAHAMMLLLTTVRNAWDFHRVIVRDGWGNRNSGRAVPALDEMALGIVGLGKIGRSVARKAQAFHLKVAAYDPYVAQDVFDWMGVRRVRQLDELLAMSDILSLHPPLTPETRQMIGRRELGLMKPGAYLINVGRGKQVDLMALCEALESGQITAAGIDVFEEEPMSTDHPILQRQDVVLTPHVAYYSESSVKRVHSDTIGEILRVLRGERPRNLVNPNVFDYRER